MSIWHSDPTVEEIGQVEATGLNSRIGIEITEVGDDYLKGTMPVDDRWGATLVIDPSERRAVGLEINANHIRSATEGEVTGVARPLHIGRQTQVWEVKIQRSDGKLSCVSRVTMAIIDRQEGKT